MLREAVCGSTSRRIKIECPLMEIMHWVWIEYDLGKIACSGKGRECPPPRREGWPSKRRWPVSFFNGPDTSSWPAPTSLTRGYKISMPQIFFDIVSTRSDKNHQPQSIPTQRRSSPWSVCQLSWPPSASPRRWLQPSLLSCGVLNCESWTK